MAISIGSVLKGQYRIDALIGGGGMATVYRAFDLNLQRVCAIKQNMDASPEAQRQFHLEAILLAKLSHPHLARVTDHFFDTSGQQYLVMDFVEGENLETLVARSGALSEAQMLAWMAGVLDAVAYCHGQGVIHRDIKPANLVKRRGQDVVVLVDFGIAKQEWGGMTMTGARAATPAYAPLEQFTGHTDARSDIYSLGATLYYLLTGSEPPDSRLVASGVASVTSPRQQNPRISPATEQAVLWAMALRVGDRPQTIGQLQAALVNPATSGKKQVQSPKQPTRVRPALIGLLVVVILAASAGLVVAVDRLVVDQPVATATLTPTVEKSTTAPATATTVAAAATAGTAVAVTATLTVVVGLPTPALPLTSPTVTETPTAPGGRPPTSTPATTDTPTPRPTNTQIPPRPNAASTIATLPQAGLFPAPVLSFPPNNSEQRDLVELQWQIAGPLPVEYQYLVTMRTDKFQEPQILTLGQTRQPSMAVRFDQYPNFFKEDRTTYFWKVVVIDRNGQARSQPSDEWLFVLRLETSQPPTPEPPTPEPPTPTPRA